MDTAVFSQKVLKGDLLSSKRTQETELNRLINQPGSNGYFCYLGDNIASLSRPSCKQVLTHRQLLLVGLLSYTAVYTTVACSAAFFLILLYAALCCLGCGLWVNPA